jgi:hypothetical protein
MTALSPGQLFVDVVGYGLLAVSALLIVWVALAKLRFPPVVKAISRLRRRQTRKHVRAAEALGLEYREQDDFGLLDLPLSLMSWGMRRWIHQITFGRYRDRDVWLFRLYFQVPGGRYGPTLSVRRGAVARIDAAFPHIVVERRGLLEAAQLLPGADAVHLDPEFDAEYRVRSTDPELAAEILDANVRRWLLGLDRHWRFELAGPWVLAYEESANNRVDERGVLDMVSDLADRVPWILTQQHPAGSSPDPDPLRVGPAPRTERHRRRRRLADRIVGTAAVLVLVVVGIGLVVVAGSSSNGHPCPECGPTISIAPPTFVPPSIVLPSISLPSPSPEPTPTITAVPSEPVVLAGLRRGEQVTVTFLGLVVTPHPTPPPGQPPQATIVGAKFLIQDTGTVRYVDFPANGIALSTTDGRILHPLLTDTFKPGFGTIRLDPGERAQGYVTFRLPPSASPATVTFRTDSNFGPQTGRWKVA